MRKKNTTMELNDMRVQQQRHHNADCCRRRRTQLAKPSREASQFRTRISKRLKPNSW